MKRLGVKDRISINSPVILGFVGICFLTFLLDLITKGRSNVLFFSVYRSSLINPLTYIRFVGHVLGHVSWSHFVGNMMVILLIGPLLEEKYGSANIFLVMVSTAIVTGAAYFIFFPDYRLLGASGIVFAFILLSSFTSFKDGKIPLTLILVVLMYIGEQVYEGLFVESSTSNFTHILGGACGAVLGYVMNKNKMAKY